MNAEPTAPAVVALGETMLSLVAEGSLADARTLHVTHGGAESNVCVSLVRLGISAAWVSRLGSDTAGDRVARELREVGVDLRWVRRDTERSTGLMLRDTLGTVRYDRAGSAAAALAPEDLDEVPIERAQAVFVTGITASIGESPRRAALALLTRSRGLRVVDPNLRPGLPGSARAAELIRPLLEASDLVLGGEHELAELVGDLRGEELARAVAALGPREVVVRRGALGAGALDEAGRWEGYAPSPVADVDPVGAGDAFTAGYLAARLAGQPPDERLAQGARCGAAVAGALGDTGGAPQK